MWVINKKPRVCKTILPLIMNRGLFKPNKNQVPVIVY